MNKSIRHRTFFNQPPARVWEFLTQPELLGQWLMKNDIQPVIGHHFTFRSQAYPAIDFDGNVYCEILEIVPEKKIVYTWRCGPEPGKITLDSTVSWMPIPKNQGTELLLEQTGFKGPENLSIFEAMNQGWTERMDIHLDRLINSPHNHETNH